MITLSFLQVAPAWSTLRLVHLGITAQRMIPAVRTGRVSRQSSVIYRRSMENSREKILAYVRLFWTPTAYPAI